MKHKVWNKDKQGNILYDKKTIKGQKGRRTFSCEGHKCSYASFQLKNQTKLGNSTASPSCCFPSTYTYRTWYKYSDWCPVCCCRRPRRGRLGINRLGFIIALQHHHNRTGTVRYQVPLLLPTCFAPALAQILRRRFRWVTGFVVGLVLVIVGGSVPSLSVFANCIFGGDWKELFCLGVNLEYTVTDQRYYTSVWDKN